MHIKDKNALEYLDKAISINKFDWRAHIGKAEYFERQRKALLAQNVYNHLYQNINKINEEEIVELIKFKCGYLESRRKSNKRDQTKYFDILNEVINNFSPHREGFFQKMRTIEENFAKFTDTDRSIPVDFPSFLVVLRKWNSYTPILPSTTGDNKGGGYFLFHNGKGIVIDPGFNFIDNFYEEGFKVADIDAIVITHAHNDHTVDFESILTLIYKYNDQIKDKVRERLKDSTESEILDEQKRTLTLMGKKLDIFMNIGAFMKYSGWINLKDSEEINSVTVLQPNTEYSSFKEMFGIELFTTWAKHHEIIDNKYCIGLIFKIGDRTIGFSSDTGWDHENNGSIMKPFLEFNPSLVIAHLGSIKRKEFDYVTAATLTQKNKCYYTHHLGLLGITKFLHKLKPELAIISEFGEELKDFRKQIAVGLEKILRIKCLPGDVGLFIRLEDLHIYCFYSQKFVPHKKIEIYASPGDYDIRYHIHEKDIDKFNAVLNSSKGKTKIPISLRLKK